MIRTLWSYVHSKRCFDILSIIRVWRKIKYGWCIKKSTNTVPLIRDSIPIMLFEIIPFMPLLQFPMVAIAIYPKRAYFTYYYLLIVRQLPPAPMIAPTNLPAHNPHPIPWRLRKNNRYFIYS